MSPRPPFLAAPAHRAVRCAPIATAVVASGRMHVAPARLCAFALRTVPPTGRSSYLWWIELLKARGDYFGAADGLIRCAHDQVGAHSYYSQQTARNARTRRGARTLSAALRCAALRCIGGREKGAARAILSRRKTRTATSGLRC